MSWEGICWPHCRTFLPYWALPQNTFHRKFSSGIKPQGSGHSNILVGLVLMQNSEISCGDQHSQGNDIVGLLAHQREVLSGSQTKDLEFHSHLLTKERGSSPLELFWHDTISQIDSWGNAPCDIISTDFSEEHCFPLFLEINAFPVCLTLGYRKVFSSLPFYFPIYQMRI